MTLDIFAIDSPDWMLNEDRNCAIPPEFTPLDAQQKSDLWFPTEKREEAYAKRLCTGCPTSRQCFAYAYERPELEGVWGGTSTGQRERLRAKNGGNRAA